MNIEKLDNSKFKNKVQEIVKFTESLRGDKDAPVDITLAEVLEEHHETTLHDFCADLGIDPTVDTINNIMVINDMDVRWIIPELIRDAIRLGLRDAPIWSNLVASEQTISQKEVTMPFLNMSDATPHKVNEGETIPLGTISYGEKSVKTFKIGRGIKITYEIKQFVSLDVVSIFFQDFGIRLGQALDTLAIDVLTNGDQADGSTSAPVIGVTTAGTKTYKDFLRIWIRASRMGRRFDTIVGGEDAALETLDMPEFKDRQTGTTQANINLKTPVPNSADYFIHGNVPADQELLVDSRYALIKFNVIPLMIESDKIVSNQTEEFYASLTTGFGKIFNDAAIILDKSVSFSTNGFPDNMDVDAQLNLVFG